jgi:hypothetical protein
MPLRLRALAFFVSVSWFICVHPNDRDADDVIGIEALTHALLFPAVMAAGAVRPELPFDVCESRRFVLEMGAERTFDAMAQSPMAPMLDHRIR